MQGTIRKANIRDTEIDKIKIEQCFLPGDIVKCKIVLKMIHYIYTILFFKFKISYGDSHRVYLSTQDPNHGVIFAKHSETG